jgi:plasmid maintenance system antidote protein VapI/Zn-dependent peptidase ImmA (M78 family)
MAKLEYMPDYAVAPGATLKEALEERGMSQSELALRTEMAEKTISQIVNGVAPISYETAEKLELVLGIPAHYWNSRELAFREALARAESKKRLESEIEWLKELPIKFLKERKYLSSDSDKSALVRQSLQFFGVSSVEAWRSAFIKPAAQFRGKAAQERRPAYVATWLRIGELQAASIATDSFNADEFRRALTDARSMTTKSVRQWYKELPERCAAAGVAVVFTREIPSAAVSGATRWLTKDKALIQLSLKFKTDDQIWFTFFHEAGHILCHGKKDVFVEYGHSDATEEEREANEFACSVLIPPSHAKQLPLLRTKAQILEFAKAIGIAPSIVVGRLHHDKLLSHPSLFLDLKTKLKWSE